MTEPEKTLCLSKFKEARQFMLSCASMLELQKTSGEIVSEVYSLEEHMGALEKKFVATNGEGYGIIKM